MIIKIQRPVITNGNTPLEALIYSEDRQLEAMVPLFEVQDLFSYNEFKVYHHAQMIDGRLKIGNQAPAQDW